MKIRDLLSPDHPTLSFEVFPPKTEAQYESVKEASRQIAELKPAFMSVTYGAGGGTTAYTTRLAGYLKSIGVESLAHLTCVSTSRARLEEILAAYREQGIENVLALRGDLPKDGHREYDFMYASDLVPAIHAAGDFCVGAACYPEGHPEAATRSLDIENLKRKVEAGCDFITTQMFFDNALYYNFLYRIRKAGIKVPVLAGIMPVTSSNSLKRIRELSGSYMPLRFMGLVDRFWDNPLAMQQAGIAYATEQIIDLVANGVDGIHIYCMNRPDVSRQLRENLRGIIG